MQYQFSTESLAHAKCALILYAMYRSRNANSPLNGLETWDRTAAFIRGAARKSTTTAEFVQNFCHMAKIESVRPNYLKTDSVVMLQDGCLVESGNVKDYKLQIFEDNSLVQIFEREGLYITMLVRERIQREKMEGIENAED